MRAEVFEEAAKVLNLTGEERRAGEEYYTCLALNKVLETNYATSTTPEGRLWLKMHYDPNDSIFDSRAPWFGPPFKQNQELRHQLLLEAALNLRYQGYVRTRRKVRTNTH